MKKIIALLLIFLFSFSMISTTNEKKPEAITLVAGYTISQILGAMALSATVVGAGYVISDSLVDPDDNSEFTDFLQTVFKQTLDLSKYEIPPPPEPLNTLESVTLLSLLTKQGIEVGKDLYEKIYNYANSSNSSIPLEVSNLPNFNGNQYMRSIDGNYITVIQPALPNGRFYLNGTQIRVSTNFNMWYSVNGGYSYTYSLKSGTAVYAHSTASVTYGNAIIYSGITGDALADYQPNPEGVSEPVEIPSILESPSSMTTPEEYTPVFKNVDMSPLNGLVKNPQELIDIVNGVKEVPAYLYGKITTAFNDIYENFKKNPNFIGDDIPTPPQVDPVTGTISFGDPKLDEPIIETDPALDELSALNKALYWLKGIWQTIRDLPKNIAIEIGNIFQYLKNFIERFWQSFTEWWENNFLYHWTLFIDWLHTLPNLISEALKPLFDNLMIPVNGIVSLLQNIWDWLQGFPDMLLGLIIPPDNSIAEVWEPVSDLFNQKIFPVIQPFQNIGFYEEELQDISADIKIGQYQGNHKIIDYSYLKSVREPIKSVIRSFFWILIIFFNLDQVHRLIRNQSIVKTYIRKVDEPGGNK